MKITFYGAVKSVTGANYLLEDGDTKILIDCGLHQGSSYCEAHNWEPFLYDPKEIKAVFVTHSHIDHIGRLPQLVKSGFGGKIFSTPPTRDASGLLLLDSEHILSQEADKKNKPLLYTSNDISLTMQLWEGVEYHQSIKIDNLSVRLYNAGHILGSSFILVDNGRTKIVFSGDLGNSPAPLLGSKEELPEADYCVMESTYGGRIHEDLEKRKEIIEDLIEDVVRSNGVLMIPAFAMERTQEMIFEIDQLVEQKRIPRIPVFIDSPLAIKLTEVYEKNRRYLIDGSMHFNFPGLKTTLTTEESKSINDVLPPKVIIAGSGMSNGGRILHHERRYLSDPNSTLLVVGYQAMGSLGRKLLDGEKKVKIFGEEINVNCKVKAISGYSAHADKPQLLNWIKPQRQNLKNIFLVQGEEKEGNVLAQALKDELAINAMLPDLNVSYELK
ncbi:MAG: MBL fold metallo-hydrolase [Patescibacteria group bacterium]